MLSQHPRTVVIHHSAGMQGFDEIRKQHLDRGLNEIGYNIVLDHSIAIVPGVTELVLAVPREKEPGGGGNDQPF